MFFFSKSTVEIASGSVLLYFRRKVGPGRIDSTHTGGVTTINSTIFISLQYFQSELYENSVRYHIRKYDHSRISFLVI